VRDLEIRGAGNILGKQQHGHIAAVGFYLYCRLLERSVQRLKGEAPAAPPGAVLDFESHGALSPDYVADEAQRVEMYRKWAAISSEEDLERWRNELRDRFGPPPEAVEALALEARLKLAAGRAGADSVSRMGSDFVFRRGKEIVLVADLPHQVHPREAYRLLIKKLESAR
jgi:transcription-repair coupling factor (superfamily II helicase)